MNSIWEIYGGRKESFFALKNHINMLMLLLLMSPYIEIIYTL